MWPTSSQLAKPVPAMKSVPNATQVTGATAGSPGGQYQLPVKGTLRGASIVPNSTTQIPCWSRIVWVSSDTPNTTDQPQMTLAQGWVRGSGQSGGENLYWTGALKWDVRALGVGGPTILFGFRNDTGGNITMAFNWLVDDE